MKNYIYINKINFINNIKLNKKYYFIKKKNIIYKKKNYNNFIFKTKKFFLNNNFIQIFNPILDIKKYNFKLLNIIKKDFKGSFYLKNKILRTHNTCFQNRYFKNFFLNENIFNIGKVFRNDSDKIHLPSFYQIDLISYFNLNIFLNLLLKFLSFSFKKKFFFKIRKNKFPFTINSFEIDIFNNNIWLEILGFGYVNKNIFINNIFNKKLIACGIGLDRIYYILKKIKNIKYIYD
ncbi:MAG: hypothetical protein ACH6QJ_00100 [Candidatus Carsonella ruddii]